MIVPILLYHAVAAEPTGRSWGAISEDRFRSHVERIAGCGRTAVTISELSAGLRGRATLPPRPVAITFDDGYEDTPRAVELLGSRGFAATVYVTTGELDRPGAISSASVSELARKDGVEIGAHGVRHLHLDELDAAALEEELSLSKAQLEQLTGEKVTSFAYPHGSYDARVREAVIAAGYHSAAAVKNALCHDHDDPFALARVTVTEAITDRRLDEVLSGRSLPLARRRQRLRTRAYRTVRRGRRRLLTGTGWR